MSKYNFIFKIRGKVVIFNPLSGALDIASREIEDILNGNREANKELLDRLISRGYIFEDESDEKKEIKRMYKMFEKIASKKQRYVIIPTYSCNLRCIYCYQGEDLKGKTELMSKKILNASFKAIEKLSKGKPSVPTISLFGGEPLMNRDNQMLLISDVFKTCQDKGWGITITTNGVDLKHYCNILNADVVKQIQITLDGPREVHDKRRIFADGRGSFDKIVEGIDTALEKDMKIALRVNVDFQNVKTLPKLADFIIDKGWEKKVFTYIAPVRKFLNPYTCCMPETNVLKKVSKMYKKFKQTKILTLAGWQGIDTLMNLIKFGNLYPPQFKNCEANIYMLAFDLYGDVYPCLAVAGEERFSIGKFFPKLKIDKDKFAMWRGRSILNNPECRDCKLNLLCGGGCSVLAFTEKKSFTESYCKPIMEALEIGIDLYFDDLKRLV